MKLTPGNYFAGLISVDHGGIGQSLTRWSLQRSPFTEFDRFGSAFTSDSPSYALYGSAITVNDALQINATADSNTGVVVHTTPVPAHFGFGTSFVWTPTCPNSSPGFSIFLTCVKPAADTALQSNYDLGKIGTASFPNLVSIAYWLEPNRFISFFG